MKPQVLAVLGVCVLAICLGAIWFLQSAPSVPPPPAPVLEKELPPPPLEAAAASDKAPPVEEDLPASVTPPVAPWEAQLDTVLSAGLEKTETARVLLTMMPLLPADAQIVACQHVSRLLPDADYLEVTPLLSHTWLSPEVQNILMRDLMNRPDQLKWPTLLEIAKMPEHPHQQEAVSSLQTLLAADYGADWNRWNQALTLYLKSKESADKPRN